MSLLIHPHGRICVPVENPAVQACYRTNSCRTCSCRMTCGSGRYCGWRSRRSSRPGIGPRAINPARSRPLGESGPGCAAADPGPAPPSPGRNRRLRRPRHVAAAAASPRQRDPPGRDRATVSPRPSSGPRHRADLPPGPRRGLAAGPPTGRDWLRWASVATTSTSGAHTRARVCPRARTAHRHRRPTPTGSTGPRIRPSTGARAGAGTHQTRPTTAAFGSASRSAADVPSPGHRRPRSTRRSGSAGPVPPSLAAAPGQSTTRARRLWPLPRTSARMPTRRRS